MAITYRPNEEVTNEIEKLKKKLKITTTTKLIDFLVINHSKLTDEIHELEKERYDTNRRIRDTNHTVSNFQSALQELLDIETKNPF